MGEQTTVSMTAKTINDLARAVGRELAKALTEPPPASPAPPVEPAAPEGLSPVRFEPWTIFDPRRQALVAGYVDDANQQRWVPIADELGVPKAWRKLYLQRAA
jgi:hypothetical protein